MFRGVQGTLVSDADLRSILAYLADADPRVASRFLKAFHSTTEDLAAMPMLGRQVELEMERLRPLRVRPVSGFPDYLLFYEVTPTDIIVIRVLHGARDLPGLLE